MSLFGRRLIRVHHEMPYVQFSSLFALKKKEKKRSENAGENYGFY